MASVTFLSTFNSTLLTLKYSTFTQKIIKTLKFLWVKHIFGDHIKLCNRIIPKLPMYTQPKLSS